VFCFYVACCDSIFGYYFFTGLTVFYNFFWEVFADPGLTMLGAKTEVSEGFPNKLFVEGFSYNELFFSKEGLFLSKEEEPNDC
jgi:hypothetical protein